MNGQRDTKISAAGESRIFISISPDWNRSKKRVEPQMRAMQAENAPLPATSQSKRLRLLPEDYE